MSYLKKLKPSYILFSFILSFFLAHTWLSNSFITTANFSSDITLTATATKIDLSEGTDVRIIQIKLDNQELPLNEFQLTDEWILSNGVLMTINPSVPASLVFHVEDISHIEIDFQTQTGSGFVSILQNGKGLEKLNLYSPDWNHVVFSKNLGYVSISRHLGKFICLFLYIQLFLFLFQYFTIIIKQYPYKSYYVIFLVFLYLSFLHKNISYSNLQDFVIYIVLNITVLICCVGFIIFSHIRLHEEKINSITEDIVWMSFSAFYAFFITTIIDQNLGSISLIYSLGNIVIFLLIIFLLYLVIHRIAVATSITIILIFLFAAANYFVNLFRGIPITPSDFLSLGTAFTVFTNYTYSIPFEIVLAFWLTFIICFFSFYLFGMKKSTNGHVLFYTFPSTLLLGVILGSDFFAPHLDLWNLNSNIERYGLAVSFISNLRQIHIDEPDGYSAKDSSKYISTFLEASENNSEFCPDIIAIMNESFSDISIFSDHLNSSDFLSHFYSLQDNTVRGNMLVYPFGGNVNAPYQVPYKLKAASAALLHCFFGFLTASGSFFDHGSRSSKNDRSLSSMCLGISVRRCSKYSYGFRLFAFAVSAML